MPTKKADVGMLHAQEMCLALLPATAHQPSPSAEVSTNFHSTAVQPEGVPPTPRIIPPMLMHSTNNHDHPGSCPSRYLSPGNLRQSPVYADRLLVYDIMMPPPVVNSHNDYSDHHNIPMRLSSPFTSESVGDPERPTQHHPVPLTPT